jgi:small subunit ribosomal protein S1
LNDQDLSQAGDILTAPDAGELGAGDVVDATVVAVTADDATLRLGEQETRVAVAPAVASETAPMKPGDRLRVFVEQVQPVLVVSPEKAEMLRLWDRLAAAARSGELIEGTVVAIVKGGLSVDVGTKAFLPASEVDLRRTPDLGRFVGQRLSFKVLRFGTKRGNVVLSRRALVAEEREEQERATLASLAVGDVKTGAVKSFTAYGAFIDLGGIDGLLHLTDMSWGKLRHPSEQCRLGDQLTVKVLAVDTEKRRISLGLKQLTADPWANVADRFGEGTDATGKVLRLEDYGAFVELAPGIEGLVHVSEMSWGRGVRPSDVVAIGDTVRVRVLRLDGRERRVALGMKQLMPNPWRTFAETHPEGTKVRGHVRSLTDFGVFVRVADGIDGLVHVSDISWTEQVRNPGERYKKGDEVDALVLNVDVQNERIALGIKQLEEDPWLGLVRRYPAGTKVTGKVMRVVDFGAFVEIEPGIDGLCHISELSYERVERTSDVVKAGDPLDVMVLDVDPRSRKISLSAKAASDDLAAVEDAGEEAPDESATFSNTLGDKLAAKLGIERKA